MSSSYEQKYYKYKLKYISLYNQKSQVGGVDYVKSIDGYQQFRIFGTGNKGSNTATYIYTKVGTEIYFGICRQQWSQRWVSVGGGVNDKEQYLRAAIREMNEETMIMYDSKKDVSVPWISSDASKPLQLVYAGFKPYDAANNGLAVFVINMPNSSEFFNIFPTYIDANNGGRIVKTNDGEIDANMSMTLQQMIDSVKSNNAFFRRYFCSTLNNVVIKCLSIMYPDWNTKNESLPECTK